MNKKTYWGYRALLKHSPEKVFGGIIFPGEDYLVLVETHYEDDKPVAHDDGQHIQVSAEEGVEGMISLLETAIRHLRERGVIEEKDFPNNKKD